MKQKSFYFVTAMLCDSSPTGHLRRFETQAAAIAHAKGICKLRSDRGQAQIQFYVMKAVAVIGPKEVPVTVEKLK